MYILHAIGFNKSVQIKNAEKNIYNSQLKYSIISKPYVTVALKGIHSLLDKFSRHIIIIIK